MGSLHIVVEIDLMGKDKRTRDNTSAPYNTSAPSSSSNARMWMKILVSVSDKWRADLAIVRKVDSSQWIGRESL